MPPESSIFREQALKRYLQRQHRGTLLRLLSPPIFIFGWLLLVFLVVAVVLAWYIRVPVYATGQGTLVLQDGQVVAVFFVTPGQEQQIQEGQAVDLRIGPAAAQVDGVIMQRERDPIGPDEARQRFNLQGELAYLIGGPSITVLVRLEAVVDADLYVGSLCVVQVQTGSRSILSLLPGLIG